MFSASHYEDKKMEQEAKFDLRTALGQKKSITIQIQDIEKIMGDDWLLEFSAQAQELGLRVDPHRTDPALLSVTRS